MADVRTGLIIGPSTGWMYAKEIFLTSEQENFLREAGATAAEVAMYYWEDERLLTLREGNAFDAESFPYRSVHLPDFSPTEEAERQVAIAREVIGLADATTAVIHPLKVGGEYPMEIYTEMLAARVPLAVENMDRNKDSGFRLEDLVKIVREVDCRFVLDVQHAYERDPTMEYASELFLALQDQLSHLHVSGETKNNNHALVCTAINAKAILCFVSQVLSTKPLPIILEGQYESATDLGQEIKFVERELGF